MITMNRMASDATIAAGRPSSARAISASDLPSRRTLAASTSMSCTAPARHTPITSHTKPGMNPYWMASTGPMSGPAPEMAAKWWPNSTQRFVGW